jgi:branched-chain amino acid transport system ATP-binding protein
LPALLKVENLISGYGKLAIVQGISFDLEKGSILAVIGPNGSGKSTLVKSIFGLTTVFDGTVEFAGRQIRGMKPENISRIGLSYVPQVSNVFPELSVKDNLIVGGIMLRDRGEREKRLKEVVQIFPILRDRVNGKTNNVNPG